jgi:response regulator RpfG family c-di-GMP phosphodiesterase
MTRLDDDILFADEELILPSEVSAQDAKPGCAMAPWKLLIADDDEEVHTLTRLVLSGFEFEGRGLEFLSAHSGRETVARLREHPDTALVLLDVVMEKDDAGLQAVRTIRRDLDNHFVRIILRTGQPGQAPEQEVISSYDINDYKAKTELTSQKLYTTVTSALRAYRDLRTIESQRSGLEKVNVATRCLFECQNPDEFAMEVMDRMSDLFASGDERRSGEVYGVLTECDGDTCNVVVGLGRYAGEAGRPSREVVAAADHELLRQVRDERAERMLDDGYACYLTSRGGVEGLILVHAEHELNGLQRDLVSTYAANVRVAYDNIHLNREIIDTQKEVIHTLGEVVESRSQETANHVKRVGWHSYLLAQLAGFTEHEAKLLRLAAPLHDVGKIGIPDAILNKPGKLSEREREIMQTHAEIGYMILGNSKRPVFQTASIVAHEHHEKWDGSGYPRGLAGEDIHIYGRIVGLVDVFDALSHERIYKPALPLEKCLAIMRAESGRHFDPRLVDLFLEHLDEFLVDGVVPDAAEDSRREPVTV